MEFSGRGHSVGLTGVGHSRGCEPGKEYRNPGATEHLSGILLLEKATSRVRKTERKGWPPKANKLRKGKT